jgi:hypothetical protein
MAADHPIGLNDGQCPWMPQNLIACDRGQAFLMPPSLADWVSEDYLVWTVLGAVDQMDLSAFYGAYRSTG